MILLGAGGHATEVLQVFLHNGYTESQIFLFDNTKESSQQLFNSYPIINTNKELADHFQRDPNFVLAVGNSHLRRKLFELAVNLGGKPSNIISKFSITSMIQQQTGIGLNVMHGVFISEDVVMGDGVLLNAYCHIHHGVRIGEYSEISPKAMILGNASVGKLTQIGAGAIINPGVKVGNNSIIGAGTVVVEDIPDNVMAVGVPAKVIKSV